jgi:cytochrome c oxidase assembly protein subunit 15
VHHSREMTAATASIPVQATRDRILRNRALVRGWLYVVLITIMAVVVVGGATRLTDSGLSITEWKPIHGVIPPLNEAEWQEEFAKYQQIPQFSQLNPDMDLAGFKRIFWWEWAHRLLARWAGVIFYALPFGIFLATRRLEKGLPAKLSGIFLLGGLQGLIGWLMVASGLTDRTSVHPVWLAIHLTVASVIFMTVMAVARGLAPHSQAPAGRETQVFAGWMVVAILFQIFLGGLVAGLDAGLSYNTWPLMDGSLIPGDLFVIDPAWRNLVENPKTVQFVHRLGAYAVLLVALWHAFFVARHEPGTTHARRGSVLLALVILQAGIGIGTLLTQVHLHWAILHQGFALIVLGFATAHWRGTKGAYPLPTGTVRP